jgi:hypothetical protein
LTDPRQQAATRITAQLDRARRAPLPAEACWQIVEDLPLAPGLLRRAALALSNQADGPAIDALLTLPAGIPGVVEGVYKAMRQGVRRRRVDGDECPAVLALDFRRSRAQTFADALRRAWAVFGDGLEFLEVDGKPAYRLRLAAGRGTLAGRAAAAAQDVQWLHGRLAPLRGTRLWLNGWCFPSDGTLRCPAQVHLVRGWLAWAAGQTETRR